MERKYVFRPIRRCEIAKAFEIVLKRIRWMDANGIRQWNVTDYAEVYPIAYYEECFENGELFVLADDKEILCIGVLKDSDAYWAKHNDSVDALYLHNLASEPDAKGAGSRFLAYAEAHARKCGKRCFRLDSAEDNPALAQFYGKRGYAPVGRCVDGPYVGILREKKL